MSAEIQVGCLVRYIAKEPPRNCVYPRRGDLAKVGQISLDRKKVWLIWGRGKGRKPIWVPFDSVEYVSSKLDLLDTVAYNDPPSVKEQIKRTSRKAPTAKPKKAFSAAKPTGSGTFKGCAEFPDGLKWPELDGRPIDLNEPVRFTMNYAENPKDVNRSGNVIGVCVRGDVPCVVIQYGRAFKAVPIANLERYVPLKPKIAVSTRKKLEDFADGLTAEQKKALYAIIDGRG